MTGPTMCDVDDHDAFWPARTISPSTSVVSDDDLHSIFSLECSENALDVVSDACACVGASFHQCISHLDAPPEVEARSTFDAATEPLIAIEPYFQRILRYSKLTPESAICAFVLVRRVAREQSDVVLTNYNIHRFLLTACMVFAKFYDDDIDTNARWARIAGLKVCELNTLEVDFLNYCQFDLRVSHSGFYDSMRDLLQFRVSGNFNSATGTVALATPAAPDSRQSSRTKSTPNLIKKRLRHPNSSSAQTLSTWSSPTFQSPESTPDPNHSSTHRRRSRMGMFHHPRTTPTSPSSGSGVSDLSYGVQSAYTSPVTSPKSSPAFHVRLPRTASLQSIASMLHASPRWKGKKHAPHTPGGHTTGAGEHHESASPIQVHLTGSG